MTEPIESVSDAQKIVQLEQKLQDVEQQIRQAEVDCAYWRGRCEEAEKLVPAMGSPETPAPAPVAAPAVRSAPATPSLDKLLPILQPLLPLLANPDVLKLLLPLLKNLSAPRPADG